MKKTALLLACTLLLAITACKKDVTPVYEITDVNKHYLAAGKLKVAVLGRGVAWLDTGTHKSLMQAGQFIEVIEDRQGLKIGCIEEVAYEMGFIDAEQLERQAHKYLKSGYGEYLLNLLRQE